MGAESTTTETGTETDQGSQGQQQQTTDETSGNGSQQQAEGQQQTTTNTEPVKLPDDHPLVKTLATQKQTLATTRTELAEARAQAAKVTQLEADLQKRPTTEALETLQTRYDRLEAFLQAAGGDLSTALDSRTFTKDLFESDKDIADIVKDWHKAHPTATSQALGSGAAAPAAGKVDPNSLLRAAFNGGQK